MNKIEILEHNLRVEMEARDRFYQEVIEKDVIIASFERRIERLQSRNELLEAVYEAAQVVTVETYVDKWPYAQIHLDYLDKLKEALAGLDQD